MPIFEFECLKCGEIFEVLQSRNDPPPKKHDCGSRRVRKVISRSSFILKGSGWYITDYARKGKTDGDEQKTPSKKPAKKDDSSTQGESPKSPEKTSEKGSEKNTSKASQVSAA